MSMSMTMQVVSYYDSGLSDIQRELCCYPCLFISESMCF